MVIFCKIILQIPKYCLYPVDFKKKLVLVIEDRDYLAKTRSFVDLLA